MRDSVYSYMVGAFIGIILGVIIGLVRIKESNVRFEQEKRALTSENKMLWRSVSVKNNEIDSLTYILHPEQGRSKYIADSTGYEFIKGDTVWVFNKAGDILKRTINGKILLF